MMMGMINIMVVMVCDFYVKTQQKSDIQIDHNVGKDKYKLIYKLDDDSKSRAPKKFARSFNM